MAFKTELKRNVNACPWQSYATHNKNKQLQCNGEMPMHYGRCAQDLDCRHCAGTLYQPNITVQQGRSFVFVECPCCTPELYRKRVERLKHLLPKGSGPTETPVSEKAAADARAKRLAEKAARLRRK